MDKAEIVATLKEALNRELLEVARLERCDTPDAFTEMLYTIQDDLTALADRCNVMNQDIITAEAVKCAVCGKQASAQCKGCKSVFCQPCYDIHIQDNWQYIDQKVETMSKEVTPAESK